MMERIKDRLRRFKQSAPGHRFQDQHADRREAHSSAFGRMLRLGAGIVVTVAGIIAMPAPGPGMLITAFGLVMLAHESLVVARLLDAAEVKLRPIALGALAWWKRRGTGARIALGALALVIAGACVLIGLKLMQVVA
jgi:hypothetical protein